MAARICIGGAIKLAIVSGCVSASRFGTSPPTISETEVRTTTMIPSASVSAYGAIDGTWSNGVRSLLASAASPIAPFRMPMLVIPTCTLERNLVGSDANCNARRAPD